MNTLLAHFFILDQSECVISLFRHLHIFKKIAAFNFPSFSVFFPWDVWTLLTCKNKNLVFHPEVKGRHRKCPLVSDGLIDIQDTPNVSLITKTQTSEKG